MVKRLTKKQKGFVKDYVKTGIGEIAALNNYDIQAKDKGEVARSIACENLTKPYIVKAIENIADKIPNELLVEKHLELLNKEDVLRGIDVNAVKAGLDMAYKLKGSYAPEKHLIKSKIDFSNLENLSNDELDRLERELKSNSTGETPKVQGD